MGDRYTPPPVDSGAPLDEIEEAIADEIAAILLRKIRAERGEDPGERRPHQSRQERPPR